MSWGLVCTLWTFSEGGGNIHPDLLKGGHPALDRRDRRKTEVTYTVSGTWGGK